MALTYRQARDWLDSSGFKIAKLKGSHEHWRKGSHTIMLSTAGNIDRALETRIRKLCSGEMTARDMVRESYQNKMELPRDNLKPGDNVRQWDKVKLKWWYGTVEEVNYGYGTARVEWQRGYDETEETWSFLSSLEIVKSPSQTAVPASAEDELAEEKEVEVDIMQDPEILTEIADESKDMKRGDVARVGLLAKFQELELEAELEHDELCALLSRVEEYGRVAAIAEQLGITVKALPFRLVDLAAEAIARAKHGGPTVDEVGTQEIFTDFVVKGSDEDGVAENVVTRELTVPYGDTKQDRILKDIDEASARGEALSHSVIGQKYGAGYKDILDRLVRAGRIKREMGGPTGQGQYYRAVTSEA
jgi:hypothetical protein